MIPIKKEGITEIAYKKAIEVLKKCSTKNGFYAAYPGYDMVFGRDSMIISLGASLLKDKKLKETFKNSLITLAKNQSKKGQIPNAVDRFIKGRKHHVDFKSVDSSLWFIIGSYIYKQRYKEASLFKKHKNAIKKAITWLEYRDFGEDITLEQLPTTDWQDAFPHKYGHTINTQALYYKILNLIGKKSLAEKLKIIVNEDKDDKLWQGEFYLPWRWKNHGKYKEFGEWFDSLGNLLAIIYDLANKEQAEKIINYIKNKRVDKPFPVKAIYPAIKRGSKYWEDYFNDCDARTPYHYLNAGIWTYIGGFYVLALVKLKKFKEAEKQLELLAKANMQKPFFSEWLNGKTGKPGVSASGSKEGNQGWNAGMYIAAYESVKAKKCLV
ncbi:hypothetical protein J4225_04710 [Candidatus Pacearchaeota archaeon]|nr:hypothetical protein [Candidatus Pacearchaeota archaeon]